MKRTKMARSSAAPPRKLRHRASVSKAFMLDANGRGTEHEGLLCALEEEQKQERRGTGRRAMTRTGTATARASWKWEAAPAPSRRTTKGQRRGRRRGGTVKVNGMRRLQGETLAERGTASLTELPEMHIELWIMDALPAVRAESRGVPAARQDQLGARVQRKRLPAEATARAGGGGCDARPGARGGGAEGRRQ